MLLNNAKFEWDNDQGYRYSDSDKLLKFRVPCRSKFPVISDKMILGYYLVTAVNNCDKDVSLS